MLKRTFALLLTLGLAACATPPPAAESPSTWFVFLETGLPTPPDRERVAAMQRGHIANFKRLFDEKKLFAAGPLRDPSAKKRGIVVVQARTPEELAGLFQPDEYVREGYMTLNATRSTVQRALASEGIDPNSIEEVRIVQITRAAALPASEQAIQRAKLRSLVDQGRFGAWYTPDSGPVAEILFSRDKDEQAIRSALAELPSLKSGASVLVWAQWLGKGVLR